MNPVSLEVRDGIAVVTIDNPPVNALSRAVRQGLVDAFDQACADDSAQAIVLRCAGRTFIAGADIREFDLPPQEPHLPDVVARIEACDKPVIAAIHGTALGGGLEVAMGCHYRVADATAKLGLPEVNLGLLPGASGTQRLPRLIGVEAALDMMLSGKPIGAGKAKAAGLVDEIAAVDLDEAVLAFAIDASDRGPRRVRDLDVTSVDDAVFDDARAMLGKKARGLVSPEKIVRAVELSLSTDFDSGVQFEREAFLECKASPQSAGLRHAFFAERAVAKVPGIGKDSPLREIRKIGVLGAGTMGAGIAYNGLTSGYAVHLLDIDPQGLDRGVNTIREYFSAGVARGKLGEPEAEAALGRLTSGTDYDGLADVDLIIEAVFESMAVKKTVFGELDKACRRGAILATNTSTLDIDEIALSTGRPDDVIGLHFFSPAHIMRLLEIVRGKNTSNEVIATSLALAKKLGKIGVVVGNCFGFVGNRMLYCYGRENQLLLLEGARPEFIDKVLYDWGMAMGPNAVGDLAGLDVGYKVRQERKDLPDDPRFYRVADMLAEQGRFGQKTGAGMYRYEKGSRAPVPDPAVQEMIEAESSRLGIERREIAETEIIERCIYALVNEGARILEEGIATRAGDIDVIWTNGYGFPRHRGGPMHYADSVGVDVVYQKICEFRDRFGPEYWTPPPLLEKLARSGRRFADYDKG